MRNGATLFLSFVVASIPIVKLGQVQQGRKLNEVSVSSVGELNAAVGNSAISKILLAAGTYELSSDMCADSAICIDRALTIEAEVPGSVVLDAKGGRRVFKIESGGTAELIGLNITGGLVTVSALSFFGPSTPRWKF